MSDINTSVVETPAATPTLIKDKKPAKVKPQKITLDPNKRLVDSRADEIALIDSLDPVRAQLVAGLKQSMIDNSAKYVDGTLATGTMAVNNEPTEVNVAKFFRLYKTGKLSEKKFLSCITVRTGDAQKILGKDTIAKISDKLDPKAPSLKIEQKDDAAPVQLTDVLARLEPTVKRFKLGEKKTETTEQQTA